MKVRLILDRVTLDAQLLGIGERERFEDELRASLLSAMTGMRWTPGFASYGRSREWRNSPTSVALALPPASDGVGARLGVTIPIALATCGWSSGARR